MVAALVLPELPEQRVMAQELVLPELPELLVMAQELEVLALPELLVMAQAPALQIPNVLPIKNGKTVNA